jgi:transcription termination factor Rho
MTDFESMSLAQLHELADGAGIDGFRRMRRDDLITALAEMDDGKPAPSERARTAAASSGSRGRRERRRPEPGRRRRREGEGRERERRQDVPSRASGKLEVTGKGIGILRGKDLPEDGIYVSPAQIKRCELKDGDEVEGPVRQPRKGERRPSLSRIEAVNGKPPSDDKPTERKPGGSRRSRGGGGRGKASFENLTPVRPHRRISLKVEKGDVLARSVDLLAPLAYGQRVLVEAQPRSGRTKLLRSLAQAMVAGSDGGTEVVALLVDERPEEVTAWEREVKGVEIESAPADQGADSQKKVAEKVLANARRKAGEGSDVILLVDSLTRLANAYGSVDPVKGVFGTGRELEEEGAGSVTVIATVLWGTPKDQEVFDAVKTTENASVKLDAGLAAMRVTPAINIAGCFVVGEESILDEDQMEALRRLRSELGSLEPATAAARLADLIGGTDSNEEVLTGSSGGMLRAAKKALWKGR